MLLQGVPQHLSGAIVCDPGPGFASPKESGDFGMGQFTERAQGEYFPVGLRQRVQHPVGDHGLIPADELFCKILRGGRILRQRHNGPALPQGIVIQMLGNAAQIGADAGCSVEPVNGPDSLVKRFF